MSANKYLEDKTQGQLVAKSISELFADPNSSANLSNALQMLQNHTPTLRPGSASPGTDLLRAIDALLTDKQK